MMNLGIIATPDTAGIDYAFSFGLKWVEFDINVGSDLDAFKVQVPIISEKCKKCGVSVGAIGRWGSERLNRQGINEDEFTNECFLIDCCAELSCPVYITNCNPVEGMSFDENCELAVLYFERLTAYAASKGVKVCTYNCPWNSIATCDPAWTHIHGKVPSLGIKFDPSHSMAGGRDYLAEMEKWGKRIYHVHLKGSLFINGNHIDDPPAGLDCTDWKSFMALLYYMKYDGMLSIEPHSPTWQGKLGENGISYTVDYFKRLIF